MLDNKIFIVPGTRTYHHLQEMIYHLLGLWWSFSNHCYCWRTCRKYWPRPRRNQPDRHDYLTRMPLNWRADPVCGVSFEKEYRLEYVCSPKSNWVLKKPLICTWTRPDSSSSATVSIHCLGESCKIDWSPVISLHKSWTKFPGPCIPWNAVDDSSSLGVLSSDRHSRPWIAMRHAALGNRRLCGIAALPKYLVISIHFKVAPRHACNKKMHVALHRGNMR